MGQFERWWRRRWRWRAFWWGFLHPFHRRPERRDYCERIMREKRNA